MKTTKGLADTRISCHKHTLCLRSWLLLLPLLSAAALLLTGCSDNDDVATTSLPHAVADGETGVRIKVTVAGTGDLNSTRAINLTDAEVREDYEFMNTLCIFVVNTEGEIELKLQPTLQTSEGGSAEGTVEEYTSGEVDVPVGVKTIYAFANWQGMESDEWEALIAKAVGDVISEEDLRFAIDDPASKVNPTDEEDPVYIPMSGSATVNLDVADLNYTQTLDVTLDRLVDKVAVYVQGSNDLPEDGVGLSSLTFSGYADKVALFSGYTPDGISYDTEKTIDVSSVTIYKTTEDEALPMFYVNETDRSEEDNGFSISLQTATDGTYGKYDGVTYTSTTARQDLPRDKVYPISLSLTSYDLGIEEVNAWLAGTGTPEMEYENDTSNPRTTEGSNLITLSEKTTKFTLKLKLVDTDGSEVDGVSWDWDYSVGDWLTISKADDGTLTASCTTASAGYTYPFKVVASWEETAEGGVTVKHSRTYNIVVKFDDISYTLSE
ncbi:MAG: hypothetical protein LUC86_00375 [Prevotellaceae bacterium]|nr:hypothetical protein [Prevotellaceae bacterium]